MADLRRGIGEGVLLVEDDLCRQRSTLAAVFFRPAEAVPAAHGELAFPGDALVERLVLAPWPAEAAQRGELAVQALGQPGAGAFTERFCGHRISSGQIGACCVGYPTKHLLGRP